MKSFPQHLQRGSTKFMHQGHEKYKFKGRHISVRGTVGFALSLVLLALSIGLLAFSAVSSFATEGMAWFGIVTVILGIANIFNCAGSLREADIYTTPPIVGIVISAVLVIAFLVSYMAGIVSML